MSIGDQLKSYMRASGLSGYAIAKATGLTQAAVSRFYSGKRGLDLVSIEKLAKYFRLELRQRPLPDRSMEKAASAYRLRQAQEIIESVCRTQEKDDEP